MDFAEQLRVVHEAKGDPARLALATVDLVFPTLSAPQRSVLRATLEAAAIPHWCDAAILSAMLEISSEESSARLVRLRKLTVVEPFLARGESAMNVHESARLALRKSLAAERSDWFRTLSDRAASYFASDHTPAGRIEWIYHRLCAAPDDAASELERLDRDWTDTAYPEDRYALAAALKELEEGSLVEGRSRVWVLLVIAAARWLRGDEAQLANVGRNVLRLARQAGDLAAEVHADALIGDALRARKKLDRAGTMFGRALATSRQLAKRDPTNADWQGDMAVAYCRVGDVLQEQGKLPEAQAAFWEDLQIFRRLTEQAPTNARWQRELAVAHSRVGVVLEAQGKLVDAEAAYLVDLQISRRLAGQDPTNPGWQRDLAMACWRLARLHHSVGRNEVALPFYEEADRILAGLVARFPDLAAWQDDQKAVGSDLSSCRFKRQSSFVLPTGISDVRGWTGQQITERYHTVRETLDWPNTTGSARAWWETFENENEMKKALVLRVAEELANRQVTITEFFLAFVYSNTDNIQANLDYLDYTRLKKAEDRMKREAAERANHNKAGERRSLEESKADRDSPATAKPPLGTTDTSGWADDQIYRQLENAKQAIGWESATRSARNWWEAFEAGNRNRPRTVLGLAEELQFRRATINEFVLACTQSNADDLRANLFYLDYTRLRNEEERKKATAQEQKALLRLQALLPELDPAFPLPALTPEDLNLLKHLPESAIPLPVRSRFRKAIEAAQSQNAKA